MEFQARIAGAEIKGNPTSQSQADTNEETLESRLRRRKQEKLESDAKRGGKVPSEFSHGVGYKVIGG